MVLQKLPMLARYYPLLILPSIFLWFQFSPLASLNEEASKVLECLNAQREREGSSRQHGGTNPVILLDAARIGFLSGFGRLTKRTLFIIVIVFVSVPPGVV